jgi:multiple sugar transport system permease protein
MRFPAPIAELSLPARIAFWTLLAAALALWLLPLVAIAATSIRSLEDINRGNIWGWPSEVQVLQNYAAVLSDSRMARFILNSFVIAVPAVAGAVTLAFLAGFALAKYKLPGSRILFAAFVGGNLVPFQSLMIPVRELMVSLGLYDTHWALILFHMSFQTGFATLLLRSFIAALPNSLIETARVDGVGELQILRHIVLPLMTPALAATWVLIFTFVWNDYFWSLVLVHSDEVRPVTAGLQTLRGMWVASWNLISAGALLAAVPPVVLFFAMQRYIVATMGIGSARSLAQD